MYRVRNAICTAYATVALSFVFTAVSAWQQAHAQGSTKDAPLPIAGPQLSPWSLGIRGILSFADDTAFDYDIGANATIETIDNDYDEGFGLSAGLNYDLVTIGLPGFRGEFEVGFFNADVSDHSLAGVALAGSDGTTNVTFGMASLYYDLNTGTSFRPYIGIGIGVAKVDFSNHGVTATGIIMDNDDTVLAGQASIGLNIDITEKAMIEIGYRYFNASDVGLTALDGTTSETDLEAHQAMLGLRFHF